jgi:hypothetical protein
MAKRALRRVAQNSRRDIEPQCAGRFLHVAVQPRLRNGPLSIDGWLADAEYFRDLL